MNLDSTLQHTRELRRQGHGRQVQEILLNLSDHQGNALDIAQIGIEMNFVGLFPQAEEMLERALAQGEITGSNLLVANNELCISRYATGKFHAAHDLFRTTRRMQDQVIRQLYTWSTDQDLIAQVRRKWLGDSPVAGKSILVAHEGGFGDLVMHSRYFRALRQDGAGAILVETPQSAAGIFGGEVNEIHDIKTALAKVDFITWNFDLFARYQHGPSPAPSEWSLPLFPHTPALPAAAQAPLDSGRGRLRIGLLTNSTSQVRHDPFRSIPLCALVPLFEAFQGRDVRFFSLNRGEAGGSDLQAMNQYHIAGIGPALGNFAQTAAALRQLDLLISIDTGPAHLAAALGRPVRLLLSAACDSRWLDHPHTTPWYQSMHLHRQTLLGDWTDPVQAMLADLPRAP